MSFLPHQEIIQRHNELFSEGFQKGSVKEASYDLHLGREIYIVGQRAPELLSKQHPYRVLRPGQFAILTTLEKIKMPADLLALIAIRTQFKLQGLVNISGFHVDPTFRGRLLFAVQNVGPTDIRLKFEEPTFSIFFAKLTSRYEGEGRDADKDVHFKQDLEGIRLQDVQLLGGSSITLAALQKDVQRLRTLVYVYGPFVVGAFIALLVTALK